MKLILVRHGKSSWDTNHSDHDRPLAPRGIKAAEKIGRWLIEKDHAPATILCSTATRTRQTWGIIKNLVPPTHEEQLIPELYGASPSTMLRFLQGAEKSPVLMVGHNPGSGELARILLQNPPQTVNFFRFPTCATMVCEFPCTKWQDIIPGEATLLDFVVPREIQE